MRRASAGREVLVATAGVAAEEVGSVAEHWRCSRCDGEYV